jgi:hypothetical protein
MRNKRLWILGGVAVLGVLLAGAYWYLFGGSEPAEVALASPSSGVPSQSGSATSVDGSFDGTWAIDTESGSFNDFTSTFAGYRVEEELGGVGANTAVGRTPDVSGSLKIDGNTITAFRSRSTRQPSRATTIGETTRSEPAGSRRRPSPWPPSS